MLWSFFVYSGASVSSRSDFKSSFQVKTERVSSLPPNLQKCSRGFGPPGLGPQNKGRQYGQRAKTYRCPPRSWVVQATVVAVFQAAGIWHAGGVVDFKPVCVVGDSTAAKLQHSQNQLNSLNLPDTDPSSLFQFFFLTILISKIIPLLLFNIQKDLQGLCRISSPGALHAWFICRISKATADLYYSFFIASRQQLWFDEDIVTLTCFIPWVLMPASFLHNRPFH